MIIVSLQVLLTTLLLLPSRLDLQQVCPLCGVMPLSAAKLGSVNRRVWLPLLLVVKHQPPGQVAFEQEVKVIQHSWVSEHEVHQFMSQHPSNLGRNK